MLRNVQKVKINEVKVTTNNQKMKMKSRERLT